MADGTEVDNDQIRTTKFFVLGKGDRVMDFVQGGCGVGDPLERDTDAVRKDVRDGLVTEASARERYGVVIDPGTMAVDEQKTETLRAGCKAAS
jgi:N-methylhydantoinase B